MKRLGVGLLGLAILGFAVLLPAWLFNVGSAGDVEETTRISSYRATFDVADDGTMRVVENIELSVSTFDRHGIFRFFDRADRSAPHLRREPYDIEVLRAGQPEPVEYLTEDQGRFLVAKIGDADVVLEPGTHTYQISYSVDDVLIDDPGGDGSRFYWQVVPGGWAQVIDRLDIRVRLPAAATDVRCAIGAGRTAGCAPVGEDTRRLRLDGIGIGSFTPVTIQTDLATPVPPVRGEEYAWGPQYDPVLAPVPVVVLVVLAAVGALAAGVGLSYRVFERTPPFPLQFAPPPGLGPAQAAYVLDERVGREQFVATVLHAAEQGAIDVRRSESGWTIQDRGGWDRVDQVSAGLATLTGGSGTFSATTGGVDAGKRLQEQLARFEDETAAWARGQGLVVRGPLGGLGGLLVLAAMGVAVAIGVTSLFGMSLLAIVPGFFAIGAVGLLMPGAGTLRTRTGRDLWSRVGGFRRVLSTPSSKQRFDFSGRQDLYTAYLPWAVAFGVASAVGREVPDRDRYRAAGARLLRRWVRRHRPGRPRHPDGQ